MKKPNPYLIDDENPELDDDILVFLKQQASEKHVAYQTLVNAVLRDYVSKHTKNHFRQSEL